MRYCARLQLLAVTLMPLFVVGCAHQDDRSAFRQALATAKDHAQRGTLSDLEMHRLHQFILDRNVEEGQRMGHVKAVVDAIVASGDLRWMKQFDQLDLDGAFGHYRLEAAWRFALVHPEMFFAEARPGESFAGALANSELAFESKDQMRSAIKSLTTYAASAGRAEKAKVQLWINSLSDVLADPRLVAQ